MRLMFSNCYKYNPPDHDVVAMARKLQVSVKVGVGKINGSGERNFAVCGAQPQHGALPVSTVVNWSCRMAGYDQGISTSMVLSLLSLSRMYLSSVMPRCQMNHWNQGLYQSLLPCPLAWPNHLQSPPARKVAVRALLRRRRKKMRTTKRRKKRVKALTLRKKGLIAWLNYRNRYYFNLSLFSLLGEVCALSWP